MKESDQMTDNEILKLILEKITSLESKVTSLETKVASLETNMQAANSRLDKIENKLETTQGWQKKTTERLEELQLSQKLYQLNTNKKLARLQDGLDTMEEILKLNNLITQ